MEVLGLAPYLPPHRPRAKARWWRATGAWKGERLLAALDEREGPGPVAGLNGLAAPCSLPQAFVRHLGVDGARETVLKELSSRTRDRLHREARAFAADRERGKRHPARSAAETLSALDRRRLALFHAALPLLREVPALPWAAPGTPRLFEVDPPALLRALGLPASSLSGARPDAIARRAKILDALYEGALGFPVESRPRDFAIASHHALDALLAVAAAQWLVREAPAPPADAEAWIPLP